MILSFQRATPSPNSSSARQVCCKTSPFPGRRAASSISRTALCPHRALLVILVVDQALSECQAAVRISIDYLVAEDGNGAGTGRIGDTLRCQERRCQDQNNRKGQVHESSRAEALIFGNTIEKVHRPGAIKNFPVRYLRRKDLNVENNIIRSTGGLMEQQELRLMGLLDPPECSL